MIRKILNIFKKHKPYILKIPLSLIVSNPYQPRRNFDDASLEELSQSIKEHGVINPIIVRKVGDKYELVAGERRVRASSIVGLKTIPAIIGDFTDGELLEIGLLENLQRENLTAMEEAYGFSNLSRLHSTFTQHDFCEIIAKRLGKKPQDIYYKLSLALLPPTIKEALTLKIITEEEAVILKDIPDKEKQLELIEQIKNGKLDVKDIKRLVKKILEKDKENDIEKEQKNDVIYLFKQMIKEYIEVIKECGIEISIQEETPEIGTEIKIRII